MINALMTGNNSRDEAVLAVQRWPVRACDTSSLFLFSSFAVVASGVCVFSLNSEILFFFLPATVLYFTLRRLTTDDVFFKVDSIKPSSGFDDDQQRISPSVLVERCVSLRRLPRRRSFVSNS